MTMATPKPATLCPAFRMVRDPAWLYPADSHRHALTGIEGAVEAGRSVTLLTGEEGAGKTLLLYAVVAHFHDLLRVGWFNQDGDQPNDAMRSALEAFHLDAPDLEPGELLARLRLFLERGHGAGRPPLLIVDDADLLSDWSLEQLRLIAELEAGGAPLACLLLAGGPDLPARLDDPRHAALKARIGTRVDLAPLTEREAAGYVSHRMAIARCACHGGASPFDQGALKVLYYWSGGVPGLLNEMAQRCLHEADLARLDTIGATFAETRLRARFAGQGPRIDPPVIAEPAAPPDHDPIARLPLLPGSGPTIAPKFGPPPAGTGAPAETTVETSTDTAADTPGAALDAPFGPPLPPEPPQAITPEPQPVPSEIIAPRPPMPPPMPPPEPVLLPEPRPVPPLPTSPQPPQRQLVQDFSVPAESGARSQPGQPAGVRPRRRGAIAVLLAGTAVLVGGVFWMLLPARDGIDLIEPPADRSAWPRAFPEDGGLTASDPLIDPLPDTAMADPATPDPAPMAPVVDPVVLANPSDVTPSPDAESLMEAALEVGMDEPALATLLYQRAALRGNRLAAYFAGQAYEIGEGVRVDVNRARGWYRLAGDMWGAAERLEELTALPLPQGAGRAPVPVSQTVFPSGQLELHWTTEGHVGPERFAVEYVPGGEDGQLQRVVTELSAILLEGPVMRWRVVTLDVAGGDAGATGWMSPTPAPR